MRYFLPLFPLNLVVFPQERLNLHIFEPRYKDLIQDCLDSGSHFAIPAYVTSKIEYGTEMEIAEIVKKYEDGRMDIRIIAHGIIKVIQFSNPWPDKKYAGGQVEPLADIQDQTSAKLKLLELLDQLFGKLDIGVDVIYHMETQVFQIAHKVGLSKEQEYHLMQISSESKRVDFLIAHLKQLLPELTVKEQISDKIKMNGYFRQMDSLDF